MRGRNGKALVIIGLLAVGLLVLGCDLFAIADPGDGDSGDDLQWQEPSTPKIVLEDLEWSYDNAEYYDKYENLIHDDFIFYFDPQDVDQGLPASWGKQDELDATKNLFENVGAANIELSLTLTDYQPPEDTDTEHIYNNVPYNLRVTMPDEDLIYVAQGHGNYTTKIDGTLDNGLDRWWLVTWYDIVTN